MRTDKYVLQSQPGTNQVFKDMHCHQWPSNTSSAQLEQLCKLQQVFGALRTSQAATELQTNLWFQAVSDYYVVERPCPSIPFVHAQTQCVTGHGPCERGWGLEAWKEGVCHLMRAGALKWLACGLMAHQIFQISHPDPT